MVWNKPEGYESTGLPAFAIVEAAKRQNRPEAWQKLHYGLLEARHTGKKEVLTQEVVERVAAEAGFDLDQLRSDLADITILDHLIEQHQEAVAEGVFGTPTLFFDNGGSGFLKMMPPPTGDDALRAWDRVRGLVAEESTIAEIKRPRKPKA
jgi:2-hydroxychromene-2-carboxylate isomerase